MGGLNVDAPAGGKAGWHLLHRLRRLFSEPAVPGIGLRMVDTPDATGTLPAGLRVLVADDNPLNLLLASEMLAYFGIKPLLAADGAEAVAMAAERRLDLILMDLQMPVLDGLGATRQIRRAEREQARARTPVVAYTSARDSGSRLSDHGIDDVLEKPCEMQAMQACLVRWCPPHGGVLERAEVPALLAHPARFTSGWSSTQRRSNQRGD
ncbi:MAG: response regulator [Rubrivivax sp.]|nr:response regulator [Rubrivivax sp.]